jgi:nitronate monooxygenase
MLLPSLRIGDLSAAIPIIQGGMGIGVSRAGLAAAVANEGGVGILSGAMMGFREPDFKEHPLQANLRAMRSEIRKARALSPKGIIGINFLVAMNHYNEIVKAAVEEGIDLIVSGAGLPTDLPMLTEGSKTKIAPIVSSARAAQIICKLWDKRYHKVPDMVVVEGPEAGGHLGFASETLHAGDPPDLLVIVKEVIEAVAPFARNAQTRIPVVAAGGIFTGDDIAEYINAGAAGVQMATRFVATEECDADIRFKQAYIDAKEEDIVIIDSPVGMPGRAINNQYIRNLAKRPEPISGCYLCLKGCNPNVAPYCISNALINAVKGMVDAGVVFVGSNAWRLKKITTVKALMEELVAGAQHSLC